MKLKNKTSLITGGTSGIGYATARLFAEEGSNVVVLGRDEKKGIKTVGDIEKRGHTATFYKTDISKSGEVREAVEKTFKKFGRIDILFNNAGINPVGTAVDTSEELWDLVLDINLKGVFLCCKHVIPYMIEQGGGIIINTGSINSFMAFENEVAYDAAKGGVLMFTRATALDFAKKNIRVNCICPGAIDTPLLKAIFSEAPNPQEVEDSMVKRHPMNRVGSSDEVAKLALFLASDDSSFITGAAINIDGGILAGWP